MHSFQVIRVRHPCIILCAQRYLTRILFYLGGPGVEAASVAWQLALNTSNLFSGLEDFELMSKHRFCLQVPFLILVFTLSDGRTWNMEL